MRKLHAYLLLILLSYGWFSLPEASVLMASSPGSTTQDYYTRHAAHWVDSVFATLSLEQRIAQLIMVEVYTERDEEYHNAIVREVMRHNVGGVVFFRGGPKRQAMLTNRLQSQVQTPLFVAMDAEWGPSMRLDSTIFFPRQMALGAINNNQLIYQMGMEVGRQLRRLGVHINFAPVVDVNNNPDNPVINFRAFGEDPRRVADKGTAYMQGMQDAGIIACAKHFPGHGDTREDSHHTLPLLHQSFEELDSIHIYPFRRLINEGLHAVMTAHLEIPSLESAERLPSSLSHTIVTELLQNSLGFNGLVITDGLQMNGVSEYLPPGELELQALLAGNDILLVPKDVSLTIRTIKRAVEQGLISEALINSKCRKVLYYKYKAGLDKLEYVNIEGLTEDLNSYRGRLLNKALAEEAITVAKNEKELLPLGITDQKRIAALAIGDYPYNSFHEMLGRYAPITFYGIDKYHSPEGARQMTQQLASYDLVIISIHNNSFFLSNNYGINGKTIDLVSQIAKQQPVVLSVFANPYSLAFFKDSILDVEAILVGYQDGLLFRHAAAQVIFGALPARGVLPVTAGPHFRAGSGIHTSSNGRIRFGAAEETGMRSEHLSKIDSLVHEGIRMKAFPGCQIVIIKDGILIYEKAFGHHTYDSLRAVSKADIYDLASITKIASTTLSLMILKDMDLLELDRNIGFYLDWLEGSDKYDIRLRDLLAHQGRFLPWIPFYRSTLDNGVFLEGIYNAVLTENFPVEVARDLFINRNFRDTIFTHILASDLRESAAYRYSDLGFMLLSEIIDRQGKQPINEFIIDYLYRPLGLTNIRYEPLKHFDLERIVPSSRDTIWRKQVLHGHVHDPAAAMLGGVSGHAGLFSNAYDVAVLMQLLLNEGYYGGEWFFDRKTVREFVRVQFPENGNRRGLGFDKPAIKPDESNPAASSASPYSFGHSGFTGGLAWADPQENLVFVFLANRTYPDQDNRKIIEKNMRTNIQQVIYDAIYYSRMAETTTINHLIH
ncbi:MAG: glycoside hydrolase family 3 N-terminal domain-containing protein [Bacteroidales bacterium]|nr:glycoside hydrolase family 3 N-terminal domain-containing protein [Bacteroidales bacterium]